MNNFLDFTFVTCVALIVFCLHKGYLGKTLQRFTKIIFNPSNIEILVILFITGLIFISIFGGVEYCLFQKKTTKD